MAGRHDVNASVDPVGVQITKEIRACDGATISQVAFNFQPSYLHGALPSTMPRARVLRYGLADVAPTPLTSVAAGADVNGFVTFPTPTGAVWGPTVGPQTLVVPCDVNNAVDISLYRYVVDIQDEVCASADAAPVPSVAIAPCRLAPTIGDVTSGTTVVNNVPITIAGVSGALDGVPFAASDRILVAVGGTVSGVTRGMNGVWKTVTSAPWARTGWTSPPGLATAVPPVQTLVYVYEGDANAGSFMQISASTPTLPGWIADVATVGANITLTTSATPSLDGCVLIVGMQVLVKNQSTASQNGIYTVTASGAWTLIVSLGSIYFSGVTGITNPGGDIGLVGVKSGSQNGGTFWRTNGASLNTATRDTGVDLTFVPWTPTGSQWFSAIVSFVGIVDMRWP